MSNPIQVVAVRLNRCGEQRNNYISSMSMIGKETLISNREGGSNNQGCKMVWGECDALVSNRTESVYRFRIELIT